MLTDNLPELLYIRFRPVMEREHLGTGLPFPDSHLLPDLCMHNSSCRRVPPSVAECGDEIWGTWKFLVSVKVGNSC